VAPQFGSLGLHTRSTSLAIIRAVWMAPTAAMEVVPGLPPLHVVIEAEAQEQIYR